MEHIAIDLGGRESQICVRAADGTILDERRRPTAELERYLQKRPPSRVILETCSEAFAVADAAAELGHQVRVVPATLARTLGIGARGVKNDRKDGRVLSEVSCRIDLPSVHIPSKQARETKSFCSAREALISARTQLINHVRGWLRQQALRVRQGKGSRFASRVRALDVELPAYIDAVLVAIESLDEQIAAADDEVQRRAKACSISQRLMTTPGVGPVTALRFIASVDNVQRFANAHALESYLGLTPGEYASSDRRHRTGITKAGAAPVRRVLLQAAWAAQRQKGDHPMLDWTQRIAHRRGKHVATTALARKLAGILYAVWRDGTRYDPNRAAKREPGSAVDLSQVTPLSEAAA